ncbi:uncharacterized protein LOC144444323 [Glandiceps talaboti]
MASLIDEDSTARVEEKLILREKRPKDEELEERQLDRFNQRDTDYARGRDRPSTTEDRKPVLATPLVMHSISSSIPHTSIGHRAFSDALNGISHKPLDLSYPKISNTVNPAYKFCSYPPAMTGSHPGIPPFPFGDPTALSAAAVAAYGAYPMYPHLAESAVTPSSLTNLKFPLSSLLRKRRSSDTSQHSQTSNTSEVSVCDSQAKSSLKKARAVPEEKKDAAYWERRRKNNDAAKRSRDARRAKEEEIALRAAFLEQENMKLRAEVSILKNELARLHYMVYSC